MSLTPTLIWLIAGIILCLSEVVLPTAFIAFVLGLSALIVAAVSPFIPPALQIAIWMGLSLILVLFSRRLIRKKAAKTLNATEAQTLTEIAPGETGRVLYEGNSWAARCKDHRQAIASNQKVYVVTRKGTTLIVVPDHLLD
jgi:membrane protein implicated in regulation of membrane protease activity